MNELSGEGYKLWLDENASTVYFEGKVCLVENAEYEQVSTFLYDIYAMNPGLIKWNLQSLAFANSSMLNLMYQFVIHINSKSGVTMEIVGNERFLWQQSALPNMKKLFENLKLEYLDLASTDN